jgi:hypothetical protein
MHDIKAIQLYAFRPTNPRSSTRHSIHTRTLGFLTQRSSKSNTSIEKTLPGDPAHRMAHLLPIIFRVVVTVCDTQDSA